ncbi:DUF1540 domain-containing protein [Haloimpatiens lingqiaonensis]|uniref:DUF1540 domain-containing protein n=1 Tax=Haloimpatiens lingqiaonensis TaxID=1380675 RepID=UPI0010FE9414|nr:DUF1540 domain-containing protein [Haloimpatiens lingqiaonensis]
MKDKRNDSIECTVNECRYHSKDADYCTLNKIRVVKNDIMAESQESTDCGSFEMK